MCFFIHKDHPTIQTAEADIVCYKIYKVTPNEKEIFRAPFMGTTASLNKCLNSYLRVRDKTTIDDGLHSFSTLEKAKKELRGFYQPPFAFSIIECIIPKGTKYYYNPYDEEYVSSSLFVTKTCKLLSFNEIKGSSTETYAHKKLSTLKILLNKGLEIEKAFNYNGNHGEINLKKVTSNNFFYKLKILLSFRKDL